MKHFDTENFAKKVKNNRVMVLNLNIRDAAVLIGISSATLSRIENGNPAEIDNILKCCSWLNCSITKFIKTKS
jgi:DNA-binding Xre family transcriptional regulator